jgi:hypothetical protein
MQRCVWLLEHRGSFSCASRLSSQGICRVAGRARFSVPAKLHSHIQLILAHATLEIEKRQLIFEWLAKNPILVLVLGILTEILYDNAPEATKTHEHFRIEAPISASPGRMVSGNSPCHRSWAETPVLLMSVGHLGTIEIIRKTNKGLSPVSTPKESAGLFSDTECWNAEERFRTRPKSIERV